MNTPPRSEQPQPRSERRPGRPALHWRAAAALSVGLLAAWIAIPAQQTHAPQAAAPVAAPRPYVSPYPAPQVDPSAPPQEPAPTF